MVKNRYSVRIGIWKSIKNVAIVTGIPALIFLMDGYTQWLPEEYNTIAFPIIGLISYFIKNYIENRN